MKKELVIEMEEECITCPHLTLESVNVFGDLKLKIHQCKHIDFCKVVRKNWEKYQPEQKHGKWIRLSNYFAQCSVCKDYIDSAIRCGYNYCPNCGARMDGETE